MLATGPATGWNSPATASRYGAKADGAGAFSEVVEGEMEYGVAIVVCNKTCSL